MFSVSRDLFEILSLAARYLFLLLLLFMVLRTLAVLITGNRERKDRLRGLPGAGTVGELIVVTGNDDFPADTYLPVPREGVLGAIRSCDLVVPCSGVRKHHLDFSWEDGVGLLIRPRRGCEVMVNQLSLDAHSDPRNAPLTHGSFLTVGGAVLRLLVFAALAPADSARTEMAFSAPAPSPAPWIPPSPVPVPPFDPAVSSDPASSSAFSSSPDPAAFSPAAASPAFSSSPDPVAFSPAAASPASPAFPPAPDPAPSDSPRPPRRADRWKEDWSE